MRIRIRHALVPIVACMLGLGAGAGSDVPGALPTERREAVAHHEQPVRRAAPRTDRSNAVRHHERPERPGPPSVQRPNVILIMTDDQGYGDFGFTGNPVIRTPHLDALAEQSVRVSPFYVSPVCAPTRAALMTGRYNYRTRVVDTWLGRAMMEPEERTVAEILQDAGYATGIFGKWHLGDNYPMRPQDQGFEEVLVHRGGGIGQPSDPPGGEGAYTDPILFRNGEEVRMQGYCTDIYFEEAMRWLEAQHAAGRPFFTYVSTNAPHSPYDDVPQELYESYASGDLSPDRFPQEEGHPLPDENDPDRLARIFAMITNIDENVGRLMRRLEDLGLAENTLVIFLVDNGPNTRRYVAGMRGMKTEVYEGGIRSPLLVRWPAELEPRVVTGRVSAHVDLMPTILDAVHVSLPNDRVIDGRSLLPVLRGESVDWSDRLLVLQSHRGNEPVRYHHVSVRTPRWKLVNNSGFQRHDLPGSGAEFELYDMLADPYATIDVAGDRPGVVDSLKARYDVWFDDVSGTRTDNYAPPRIHVGTPYENPSVLTRQDWRYEGDSGGWSRDALGYWLVDVRDDGPYDVVFRFDPSPETMTARMRIGGVERLANVPAGNGQVDYDNVTLPIGEGRFEAVLEESDGARGVHQVEIDRTGEP